MKIKITLDLDPTVIGKTFSKNQSTLVYSIGKIDFILVHYGKLLSFEFDNINDGMRMKPCQS
jgi:hypothetical protein